MATIKENNKTIDGIAYTAKTLSTTKALFLLPRIVALFGDGIVELVLASDDMLGDEEADSEQTFRQMIAKIALAVQSPRVLAQVMVKVAETAADPEGIFKGNGLSVLKDMMAGVTADKVMMGASEPTGGNLSVYEWYDEHFSGRLKHLLAVCVWVGQVNFFDPSAEDH